MQLNLVMPEFISSEHMEGEKRENNLCKAFL